MLLAVYVFSYVYLLFKDRDALRSERFTLSKIAMEKGYYGDSLTGTLRHEPTGLAATSSPTIAQITAAEDQK